MQRGTEEIQLMPELSRFLRDRRMGTSKHSSEKGEGGAPHSPSSLLFFWAPYKGPVQIFTEFRQSPINET